MSAELYTCLQYLPWQYGSYGIICEIWTEIVTYGHSELLCCLHLVEADITLGLDHHVKFGMLKLNFMYKKQIYRLKLMIFLQV